MAAMASSWASGQKKCWEDNYRDRPEYQITKITSDNINPKEDGKVRIVCISDTHSSVEMARPSFKVPNGDILIHAGDFTEYGKISNVQEFDKWLGSLPHKHKIVVAGNHEVSFDRTAKRFWEKQQHRDVDKVKSILTNCIYLEDKSVMVEGYKIYGTPWQPLFFGNVEDWAFAIPHLNVRAWEEVCSKIPADIDILVSHSPPLGIQGGDSIELNFFGPFFSPFLGPIFGPFFQSIF